MAEGYALWPRSIFNAPAFRGLSDRGVRGLLYLAAGPHSNIIGAYALPDGYMGADLEWPIETVAETVQELVRAGFVERFGGGRYILLVRHRDWNTIANPNVMKAALKQLESLPPDPELLPIFSWLKPLCERFKKGLPVHLEAIRKRFAERLPEASRNTEAETEATIENPIELENGREETNDAVDIAPVLDTIDLFDACGPKLSVLVGAAGGEAVFRYWFAGAKVSLTRPRQVVIHDPQKRAHVQREFATALRSALGADMVIVDAAGRQGLAA